MAKCNKCFMDNLTWQKDTEGWRLYKGFRKHSCIDIGNISTMDSASKLLVKNEIQDQYNDHLSRINQCRNERIKIMLLGDNYGI